MSDLTSVITIISVLLICIHLLYRGIIGLTKKRFSIIWRLRLFEYVGDEAIYPSIVAIFISLLIPIIIISAIFDTIFSIPTMPILVISGMMLALAAMIYFRFKTQKSKL